MRSYLVLPSQMAIPIAIPRPTIIAVSLERGQYNIMISERGMLTMTSGPIYRGPVLYIYTSGTAVARSALQGPSPVRQSSHGSRLIALAGARKSLSLRGETDGSAMRTLTEVSEAKSQL